MTETEKIFIADSKKTCEDTELKHILLRNLNNYYSKWNNGRSQFTNIELARKKLYYLKHKSTENLEKHLIEFESKFTSRGGKIFFASGKEKALQYILNVIRQNKVKKIVKSKSMVCEEIELENFLTSHGVSVLETDLGEFIVQLSGEKPSHIVSPAMHKSRKEIYEILNNKYEQTFDENTAVETVVLFVRNLLREEFAKAGAGITGCNFLVADIGAVAITENEANAILSASFPKIHIVVTSIEKIIQSVESLELFQTMLSSYATGQKITAYNHLFFGPANENEPTGPKEMHIIIINNNRISVIGSSEMREAMYCIKCGACHNFCPVYKQIGGHSYRTVYNGPIGSVISQYIFNSKEYAHLPYASTLCGKCNDICPVNINLTSLLINSRKNAVTLHYNSSYERFIFNKIGRFLYKRKRMDKYPVFIKNYILKLILRKTWKKHRELPSFAEQSFNKIKKNYIQTQI